MLRLLLEYDAYVGHHTRADGTSLSKILLPKWTRNGLVVSTIHRETKLEIVSILVQHAQKDRDTLMFLQSTLEEVIRNSKTEEVAEVEPEEDQDVMVTSRRRRSFCDILLDGGVHPNSRALIIVIRAENMDAVHSLVQHGGNPFLHEKDSKGSSRDDASPFLIASRLGNILVLDCFMDRWDECRFSKNHHDHHHHGASASFKDPLHATCSDPHVPLQSLVFIIHKHCASSLITVDNEQGLLPFLSAAAMDNIDATFYLLKHCPNALCEYRLRFVSVSAGAPNSGIDKEKKKKKQNSMAEQGPGVGSVSRKRKKYERIQSKNESLQVENEYLRQRLASLLSQVENEYLRQRLASLLSEHDVVLPLEKDATAEVEI